MYVWFVLTEIVNTLEMIRIFVTSQIIFSGTFIKPLACRYGWTWTCLPMALLTLAGSLKWNVWPAELKWLRRVVFPAAQASESIHFSAINPYSDCWLISVNNLRLSRSTASTGLISLTWFSLINACHWVTIRLWLNLSFPHQLDPAVTCWTVLYSFWSRPMRAECFSLVVATVIRILRRKTFPRCLWLWHKCRRGSVFNNEQVELCCNRYMHLLCASVNYLIRLSLRRNIIQSHLSPCEHIKLQKQMATCVRNTAEISMSSPRFKCNRSWEIFLRVRTKRTQEDPWETIKPGIRRQVCGTVFLMLLSGQTDVDFQINTTMQKTPEVYWK